MTPRPSRGEPAAVASRPAPPRAPAAARARVLERVRELLGDPGLAWLVQRVRGQLESGADPVAVQQLPSSTPAQREGARRVLGASAVVRGTHLSVRVDDVEELLREVAGWEQGLAAAVAALDADQDQGDGDGDGDGDHDGGAAVALPDTGPALVTGPPPPRAAAAPAPVPAPAPAPAPAPVAVEPPEPWQELDEAAADELGAALADLVLALDLPAAPDGPTGAALAALSEAGLPALLTLAQLRSAPPTWLPAPPGGTALVCASPAVLAAVAAAPPGARRTRLPVVCLDATAAGAGADPEWPGEAVVVVLGGLRRAGWRLLLDAGWGPEAEVIGELLAGELDAEAWTPPAGDATPLAQRVAVARRLQG